VEWHLRKVFGKLGIRSRHELVNALDRFDSEQERAQPLEVSGMRFARPSPV